MKNLNINHGGKIFIRKRYPKVKRNCLNCGKEISVWQSRLNIGRGKFCSTRCGKLGKFNFFWKGGIRKGNGYVWIYKSKHPFATKRGYILEHRLLMEQKLGRYLRPKEIVHHINHIRNDNKIENLELIKNQSSHYTKHMTGNKIWLGKKHKMETLQKMRQSWTIERRLIQSIKFKGKDNSNYKEGKYAK